MVAKSLICLELKSGIEPRQDVTLVIHRASGAIEEIPITLRIDTPIEVDYYRHGGILAVRVAAVAFGHDGVLATD